MVNWCPGSLTAISDEEVIPTKQKGFLYYVKYELVPLSGGPDYLLSGRAQRAGGRRKTHTFFLVPKLHLGTQFSAQFHCLPASLSSRRDHRK